MGILLNEDRNGEKVRVEGWGDGLVGRVFV